MICHFWAKLCKNALFFCKMLVSKTATVITLNKVSPNKTVFALFVLKSINVQVRQLFTLILGRKLDQFDKSFANFSVKPLFLV